MLEICVIIVETAAKLIVMCNYLALPSCLCLSTPPQLCLYFLHYVTTNPSLLCLQKSIPFISSNIVHLIHFIDHSPSPSYLPYLVVLTSGHNLSFHLTFTID